ncbi:MAG: hypothetical protein EPO32_14800 [Anaerolineae bacterium]|nr:MAG: hypothetical protein EPO32_14800 [Anaerolineae bacterium]
MTSARSPIDYLDRARALSPSERAAHLANPEPTASTTTDPLAARAIDRWEAAVAGLELARQMIGDALNGSPDARAEAERALRIACGRVEAAGSELCVVAASLGVKR